MEYFELEPHRALRPFVRCFWCMRDARTFGGEAERIVPDGCTEIVLNAGDRFRRLDVGGPRDQAEVLVVGQMERAISIASTGRVDLLGVRFQPGGLHALVGAPMHELTGRDLCLGQLDEPLRRALARALNEDGVADRVRMVERVLAERLEARGLRSAGLIGAAIARLDAGATRTDELARGLGVNRRSLERMFRSEVGLAPKRYARIRRVQAVLGELGEPGTARPALGWGDVAAAHGFADQSHLIRDFRAIVGTTPRRYLAERTAMSALFTG